MLPDGRCDIILRFKVVGAHPIGAIDVAISGPSTTYHMVPFKPDVGFVGVRLRPGMARIVLGVEPSSIANRVLRGEAAIAAVPALAALCKMARTTDDLMDRLTNFVADRQAGTGNRAVSTRSLALLDALHVSCGRLSVADLATMHSVDQRTVRRTITSSTGLGPKEFSMILQFHRAVRLLRNAGLDPASAAAEAGYADQAHMTRVFRKLGGFTPADMPYVTLGNLPLSMSDLFKTHRFETLNYLL